MKKLITLSAIAVLTSGTALAENQTLVVQLSQFVKLAM